MARHINNHHTKSPMTHVIITLFSITLSTLAFSAVAADNTQVINDIYKNIRAERIEQAKINQQREKAFLAEKHSQQQALEALRKEYQQRKAALANLKAEIAIKDEEIHDSEKQLSNRTHNLKDLFSAWRQVATDTLVNHQNSLISSESTANLTALQQLVGKKALPDSSDLKALATYLQQDIQQSAQVKRFDADIALLDGSTAHQPVQRVGVFTATSDGQFIQFDSHNQSLSFAPRQPLGEYTRLIASTAYQSLDTGSQVTAVIDPSRGVVLERLALSPTLEERLQQGGYIGFAIIILGAAGLLLAVLRWLNISLIRIKIHRQMKNPSNIDTGNPLGKILAAYQNSMNAPKRDRRDNAQDTESLEVRLQEIVLQEMPKLDKGLGTLKLLAAVAPLLGLLGTVVGMINTFQTITLVGNADPKLMAGGISQALMTTVLGLLVAVPLLFSHGFVSSRARLLMIFLSQQSLGFIAQSLENKIVSTKAASDESNTTGPVA